MDGLPPFQEWVVQLFQIINHLVLAIAAILSVLGIWQWKRELVGKSNYDIAKKILVKTLELRDYLKYVNYDEINYPRFEGGTDSEYINNWNEYEARRKEYMGGEETVRELEVLLVEGEAMLKAEDLEPIQGLMDLYTVLIASMYLFYKTKAEVLFQHRELSDEERKNLEDLKAIVGNREKLESEIISYVENAKKRLGKYIH